MFSVKNCQRVGAFIEDKVVDLSLALYFYASRESGAKLKGVFPINVADILEKCELVDYFNTVVKYAVENTQAFDTIWWDISKIKILPPIGSPGKVICVAMNYRKSDTEVTLIDKGQPYLFAKPASSTFVAHGDAIVLPSASKKVTYEAELAVVIGRQGKFISPEDALQYVGGYTAFNDITIKDLDTTVSEKLGVDWFRRKLFDTSSPIGPWVVTKDEIANPQDINIQLRLNGELMQAGNTKDMIFSIPCLISYISQYITLEPGDIIATGAPLGKSEFLQVGDIMEVEIEEIGILTSYVSR